MLASAFSSSLRRAQVVPRVTGARFMGGKASSSAFQVSSKTRRRATAIGTILVSMAAADLAQSSLQSSRGSSRGLAACAAEAGGADRWAASALFPAIMPYEQGMLKVSDIHTIAYFVYGNPTGKPVLVVHGGPGSGTTHDMARYFDPAVYRIVLVDQRGCGKSTPFADLRENTTWDSVRDFEKVRRKLGIDKWQVFGGSWGSTLSLAYSMEHPDRVTELIVRGIFLLRDKELRWMYQGPGGSYLFPEDWANYENAIPKAERGDFIKAYGKRLRGEMGKEEMSKACKAWAIWEGRISRLVQDPIEDINGKFGDDHFSLGFARIENHYFTNKGWFPRDGYLLEPERLERIKHIPTVIVQGRYDVVCPPVSAYELHKGLPNSELVYTLTGHSGFETEIIKELVKATEKFKDNGN